MKEFQELETNGIPAGIVVGESAVDVPENLEIMKTGLVVWIDVAPEFSWSKTQMRPKPGGGLFIPFERVRPPVWCIANGWDGDIDDGEAKADYIEMVTQYGEKYEAGWFFSIVFFFFYVFFMSHPFPYLGYWDETCQNLLILLYIIDISFETP